MGTIIYIDTTLEWIELPINEEGSCVENLIESGYVQSLDFQIVAKRSDRQAAALAINNSRWAFVLLDNNDKFWAVGLEGMGAKIASYNGTIGSLGDLQGYRFNFLGQTASNMKGIASDAFDPDLEKECPLGDTLISWSGNNYGLDPIYLFNSCLVEGL